MQQQSFNKLRGRIVEKFGTVAAFCREIGITEASASLKLSGKVPFMKKDIDAWMIPLDICVDQLVEFFFPEYLNDV